MNKIRNFYFLLFLIFIFSGSVYGQTTDEIIDNYARAMGGADKMTALNSVRYTGIASTNFADIPMTMTLKRNGKTKMILTYQGMNLIRASDGNTAWIVNPFQGTKDAEKLPSEELKELKKFAELEGELINYKEKGYKVDYLGKDDFEGSEVFKIRVTDKDGDVNYYFLDTSNYLILKESSKRKVKEKEVKSETVYGNYQKFDGVLFPMSMEISGGSGVGNQKIIIEKVETNLSVDDDIFKMPVTK